jgi:hypothetical protein
MAEHSKGRVIAGVYFFPGETSPTAFHYYPAEPSLAQTPSGEPQLTWLKPASLLLLETRWSVDERVRDALEKISELSSGLISFTEVSATVREVTVELGDGEGNFTLIGTPSTSSGYAPFNAVFNATLDERQAELLDRAASQRQPIQLRVTYDATLRLRAESEATCSIVGDVTKDIEELLEASGFTPGERPMITIFDSRDQIEKSLDSDRLVKKTDSSPNAPDDLKEEAEAMATEWAAKSLRDMALSRASSMSTGASSEGRGEYTFKAEGRNIHTSRRGGVTEIPVLCVGILSPLIS